ncbi:DNA-binding protein YbiB [Hydrogenophaga aquatica]
MGISHYIKDIGRGKDGARALSREAASDLLGQVLDGQASDLEVGAFCIAMRVKGETPDEMAGFLDAVHARLPATARGSVPTVILPCYNGARKLPALAALLALLLARRGLRVLIHGQTVDPGRVTTHEVLGALAQQGMIRQPVLSSLADLPDEAGTWFLPTAGLLPSLQKLLDVRRVVGLRNSAHSLVKLLNPCTGPSLLVSSYTHPEYLHSMGAVLRLTGTHAMLLRGTEGEPVADPRRTPQLDLFSEGDCRTVEPQQAGSLASLPDLPPGQDREATAQYIAQVLRGERALPGPIATQIRHIEAALAALAQPA